jgi:Bacterial Ig domain
MLLYTSLSEGGITVNARIAGACLGLLAALLTLQSACMVISESGSNKTLVISSLAADYMSVYPKGALDIKCVVTAPEGDNIQYIWSSDGGSLTGEGSTVEWKAPNDYGDYHVMITAKDSNGGSDQAVLTLSVVPRPVHSCCGRR